MPDGAPGDAPTAAHAPGRTELVPPGRELVGEPLAVAVLDLRPEVGIAGHAAEALAEAAVPGALGRALDTVEVRGDRHARAEAGGADERAVRAGQAALRDLGPARVIERGPQAGRQARRRGRDRRSRLARLRPARAARSDWSDSAGPSSRRSTTAAPAAVPIRTTNPSSSSDRMMSAPLSISGPVPIEVQKQVLAAVAHSTPDHERGVAAGDVVGVAERTGAHRPVLDAQGGDLAGAGAHEGEARRIDLDGLHHDLVAVASTAGQGNDRGVGEALPGRRADVVVEEAVTSGGRQPVRAGRRLGGPALGQLGKGGELVVDDRAVDDGGTDDAAGRRRSGR